MVSGDWSSKFWDDWIVQGWWKFLIFKNKFQSFMSQVFCNFTFKKRNLWLTSFHSTPPPFFHTPKAPKIFPPKGFVRFPGRFHRYRYRSVQASQALMPAVNMKPRVSREDPSVSAVGKGRGRKWSHGGVENRRVTGIGKKNTQIFFGGLVIGDGLYRQITLHWWLDFFYEDIMEAPEFWEIKCGFSTMV